MRNINQVWDEFKIAGLNNRPSDALIAARQLIQLSQFEPLPVEAQLQTLAAWKADNPGVPQVGGSVVLRSLAPALAALSNYMLVYQDVGEGISVLIPKP